MYNELIDALRYCADEGKICTEQTNCGYYGKGFFCQDVLQRDAADALERLVAEVERWKTVWKTAYKCYQSAQAEIDEMRGTEPDTEGDDRNEASEPNPQKHHAEQNEQAGNAVF